MSSKRFAPLLVALVLLLAGCAGAGNPVSANGGGDGGELAASGDAEAPQEQAQQSGGDGGGSADSVAQADAISQQRAIIRTGRMVVEVDNFSTSRTAVAAEARSLGGYVSDSNQRLHRSGNATWRTGYVVVRIPSEDYESMQEYAGARGTIVSEETETQDVTDQLVDLEARLENLRQRRDRLRTFYSRANDTEELLRIEEQLSEVQGEIERLEAQRRSLEQRVAFSTLRVELREPAPGASDIRAQYHQQSLVAVFLGSVEDVYVFGRATLVTGAAALPWLAVLAVPVLGVRRALRGRSFSLPSVRSDDSDVGEEADESDSGTTDTEDESGGTENEERGAGADSTESTDDRE
ncbi:DUF4349 domain-containing protein [Halomicroarcula sp. GCM10025324]|uniref:DUF4349 domain-containing protein n=1 Tax=Haloarcula TaxID=2237 RepID=UPI0023E8900D|nr:DUF4349 domain-containing protein [Halomicroarcula sp. ZS-22-S1]